ncbi:unnamed protein product [Caenorhabditis angaria]|uniref:Uncharacterized protein n=1 Tax=Caenorhabditis angaria TaxID=860376 RepID=A0A9P1IMM9_9PELO|nr:unnamed protein product [Caenorhabditis angaria]
MCLAISSTQLSSSSSPSPTREGAWPDGDRNTSHESLLELSQINKDVFSPPPGFLNQPRCSESITPSIAAPSSFFAPNLAQAWQRPIKIDLEQVLGSKEAWENAFSTLKV